MKKDSLTNRKKKSIIKSDGVFLFLSKSFIAVKTAMRNLFKGCCTDCYMWRMFRHILVKLNSFLRRTVMKNMTTNRGRFATALLALGFAAVVAFFLTACGGGGSGTIDTGPGGGGGGGGGTNYITCWNGSQAVSPASCPVANPGASLSVVNGLPNKINVAPGAVISGGTMAALAGVSVSSYSIQPNGYLILTSTAPVGGTLYQVNGTVTLANAPSQQFTGTFTTPPVTCSSPLVPNATGNDCVPPTCTLPAVWDGSACTAPVLHYETVLNIWEGSQIFIVNKTSVTLANNKTQYTTGDWPLWGCWVPNPSTKVGILADGQILHSCQDAGTLHRHYLALNPITGDQTIYVGPVPATLKCVDNPDFSWTCPANSDWVAYQTVLPAGTPANVVFATQVSDGWFTAPDAGTVNFKPTTGTEFTVATKPSVPMKGLFTFSN